MLKSVTVMMQAPLWHVVSVSHSGIQNSGFPLHWLQKYGWAHSRWTCHTQHLQDPNSQQGKTEGQRKFCHEEFYCATWEAKRRRWNTMLFKDTWRERQTVNKMSLLHATGLRLHSGNVRHLYFQNQSQRSVNCLMHLNIMANQEDSNSNDITVKGTLTMF